MSKEHKKNYTKCQSCVHCKVCFANNLLGLCNGKNYINIRAQKENYEQCKTCIHNGVCLDNNLLGQCSGNNYYAITDSADYLTALTFLPTPYPKELKGEFIDGYHTAIKDSRLKIEKYYKE